MRALWVVCAAMVVVSVGVCGCASSGGERGAAGEVAPARREAFAFTDDEGRVYDALLRVPRGDLWNGYAVLLIGGGSVTDMHWTVPGWVEHEGERIRMTLSGEATRDADVLGEALLSRGFAVMQWSSIHRGDEAHAENPSLADYVPYGRSVEITGAALAALRGREGIAPGRVALVGHSLGAARALQIAAEDEGIAAMVLLSGAYTSRLNTQPSMAAGETVAALADLGLDADAGIGREAWEAARAERRAIGVGMGFEDLERDGDGVVRRWEIASGMVLSRLRRADVSDLTEAEALAGRVFPADVLTSRRIPTLAIYGGLDTMAVHAPLLEHAVRQARAGWVRVVVMPRLGHQLGREVVREDAARASVAGRAVVGPIDTGAVSLVAGWLGDVVER